MHLVKRNNIWLIILFSVAFLLTRVFGLGTDAINPDGYNWHYRSEQFVVGLKTFQFEKTNQHYHPGVTLMWIIGPTVEVLKQFTSVGTAYNHHNFLTFHFFSKFVLVLVQLVLSLFLIYFLALLFDWRKAVLMVSLFSFEPFFVGNSRLLHMDVLLSLFLILGLLLSFLSVKELKPSFTVLSGIFLGFAFLTKSVALGGFLFAFVFGGFLTFKETNIIGFLKYIGLLTLSFIGTVFVFFPALWVAPIVTLTGIFEEAERVGIRKGHGQIFLGEYSRDPGVVFYPIVLALKTSLVTLLGVLIFSISDLFERKSVRKVKMGTEMILKTVIKNTRFGILKELIDKISVRTYSPILYLTIFYIGYLVVMSYPSKKLDRYMLPMIPYLATVSILGYYKLSKKIGSVALWTTLSLLVLVYIISPMFSLYPYYFTYTNPVFGDAQKTNKIIAQKPFGIGIPALKEVILSRYEFSNCIVTVIGNTPCYPQFIGQDYPKLGFIDTKPMKAIYPNSKIVDIRVSGTSDYDVLILGPNEQIPDKVLESKDKFIYDTSYNINGLEYWKIYVKKAKP